MKTQAIVKQWGSSLGIVIPREVVKEEKLHPKEKVVVEIIKKPDIMRLFGLLKLKKTAQKLKDEARKGWQ